MNPIWSGLTSSATLNDPFIGEPEYDFGDINDVSNVVFLHGGIDEGIPSDGDRWTEYGYGKYSPAIWSATRTGTTPTITDEDNTVFSVAAQANDKCVKFSTTGNTEMELDVELNIVNTEYGYLDAEVRLTTLNFNIWHFCSSDPGAYWKRKFYVILEDGDGHHVRYRPDFGSMGPDFNVQTLETKYEISLNHINVASSTSGVVLNRWQYVACSSFSWDYIVKLKLAVVWSQAPSAGWTWGFSLDGLVFVGGYQIEPFQAFSELLNPPAVDATSLGWYGTHVLHYQNTQLSSFEQAQAEGTRLLANLKYPHPSLNVTKGSAYATKLRPSNVVTIDSVDYRIASMAYDWTHKTQEVHVDYKLIEKAAPLPPIWQTQNELRYWVK
jgi:hypothetical protein